MLHLSSNVGAQVKHTAARAHAWRNQPDYYPISDPVEGDFAFFSTVLALARVQAQEFAGVLLQDQWAHFGANGDVREIGEPAIRGEQGIVATEEHFVLEQGIGVLDKLGREVFGGPAGEVDIDLRFVQTERASSCQGNEG